MHSDSALQQTPGHTACTQIPHYNKHHVTPRALRLRTTSNTTSHPVHSDSALQQTPRHTPCTQIAHHIKHHVTLRALRFRTATNTTSHPVHSDSAPHQTPCHTPCTQIPHCNKHHVTPRALTLRTATPSDDMNNCLQVGVYRMKTYSHRLVVWRARPPSPAAADDRAAVSSSAGVS